MCIGASKPAPPPPPAPLPEPVKPPPLPDPGQDAVKVDEGVKRTGDQQKKLSNTKGTEALRIDLNVPGGSDGSGLNIPQ